MARPDAAEVLKILRELGARLELDARAYGRTAENLSLSPIPLDQLIAEGHVNLKTAIKARQPFQTVWNLNLWLWIKQAAGPAAAAVCDRAETFAGHD